MFNHFYMLIFCSVEWNSGLDCLNLERFELSISMNLADLETTSAVGGADGEKSGEQSFGLCIKEKL